ncbi:MAG: flagellar export chaperone FliS [Sedimentisphaerales bacterium]|nr:flagellar export chaperone FliS [Sedimentisphaerales bacterium]
MSPLAGEKTAVLIRLYEGAIRFLCEAVEALEANDQSGFSDKIICAKEVLSELQTSVDPHSESEVAANLYKLYSFMGKHLSLAQEQQDSTIVQEVIGLLDELTHTFRFITQQMQ